MSLSQQLDTYESAIEALNVAIAGCASALREQDGEAISEAMNAQQAFADDLLAVQRRLGTFSQALGHSTLKEAIAAHADAAVLQRRYRAMQSSLKAVEHAIVSQAETISRALTNNAELLSLLTNTQPANDYAEDGQTNAVTQSTLQARA